MIESKKQQVKNLVASGDIKGALAIAKGFKIEFDKEQQRTVQIAYEILTGKEKFYIQLGVDTEKVKQDAIRIMYDYAKK